ncbi:class I adenylate-forming enzyme family protein [Nocardia sp. NPDC020380]|uniref:class I adenylate-forming enzyme family protein n=1 Tax=Nocardia sp. NPDC020380 TaxID=3364309 RepID=UPI00378780E2
MSRSSITLDGLLRAQARSGPGRPAIRTPGGVVTFAELDAAAGSFASWLAAELDAPQQPVAITNALVPEFAAAYYGVVRSGNTVVVLNPLLPAERLVHVLATGGVRIAVVTAEVADRLAHVRDCLPLLTAIVPLDALPSGAGPILAEPDSARTACVQFTSGTTGLPKGVRLTDHNVATNARQVATAHRLDETSVTVNHLPTYHPMHLNAAVAAGAVQILCADADSVNALAAVDAHRATHFYSLPVRLARLAADPRLRGLRLTARPSFLSGGSALPARVAETLHAHFGVPVAQGYGLAEMSPLTHSDDPIDPTIGSVGRPVFDTECRITDLDTGDLLACGERGEVRVRGPQLMSGYLGREDTPEIDADGWFATGDVGYLDRGGRLVLVDRIKDVFKCDNWLVAPSEIEEVLGRHDSVTDCVVVDLPDEFRGHVAAALVVLDRATGATGAGIATWANAQLPEYQQLQAIAVTQNIPRSPNGKVSRRDLREIVRRAKASE